MLKVLIFLISSIDATSNCSIPLSMIVLITSVCGLVLTAYKILPGNLFRKNLTADFIEFFVRVAVSNEHAEIDLSKKFGALTSEAIGLLRLVKQHAIKVGLSFHVGSQCMHPISYAKGISEIGNIIKKTKIIPDYINVGGGFPTIYPDLIPQSLDSYFNEINKSLENLRLENFQKLFVNLVEL